MCLIIPRCPLDGVRITFNCDLNTITYLLYEQTSPEVGCSEGGSDGSIVSGFFFLWPHHLIFVLRCFCLISARWLPQIQTSHPHAVMFKGKRQSALLFFLFWGEKMFPELSVDISWSLSQKCILWPPSAARKVGKERISGFFILQLSGEGTD